MSKKKRLSVKEKLFVKNIAAGKTGKDAIVAAGYNVSSSKSANVMASTMNAKPKIQNALATELERMYPDLEKKASEYVWNIITDEHQPPLVVLKFLEFAAKAKGWQAPTKTAKLNVNVDKWALPEE